MHASAITNPKQFVKHFKDLCFCATCATFYVGHAKGHNCLVHVPYGSPILTCLDLNETMEKYEKIETKWDYQNSPGLQMLNSIAYQDLLQQFACSTCKRWLTDLDSIAIGPAPLFANWNDVKRKVLYAKEIPEFGMFSLMPHATSLLNFVQRLSTHHRLHTFCIASTKLDVKGLAPLPLGESDKCIKCGMFYRSKSCKTQHKMDPACGRYFFVRIVFLHTQYRKLS